MVSHGGLAARLSPGFFEGSGRSGQLVDMESLKDLMKSPQTSHIPRGLGGLGGYGRLGMTSLRCINQIAQISRWLGRFRGYGGSSLSPPNPSNPQIPGRTYRPTKVSFIDKKRMIFTEAGAGMRFLEISPSVFAPLGSDLTHSLRTRKFQEFLFDSTKDEKVGNRYKFAIRTDHKFNTTRKQSARKMIDHTMISMK